MDSLKYANIYGFYGDENFRLSSENTEAMKKGYQTLTGMEDIRLVVLGGGCVGKSTFTIYFVQRIFFEEYDPTIEDSYRKQILICEQPVVVDILDTAGEEEYSAMRDQYMRTAEGFFVFYAITNKYSFEEVQSFVEQIQRVKDVDHSPTVIVGNKCDLESEREVQTHEGERMAEKFKLPFFETSAKFGINVDEAVYTLATEIYQSRNKIEIRAPKNKKQCVIC